MRLLVLRENPDRVEEYWKLINKICEGQSNAGIEVRVLAGTALFDPTIASEDFVTVDENRVHTHAQKLDLDIPYTTATLSICGDAVHRRIVQWDRMWADAIPWPLPKCARRREDGVKRAV